MKKVPKKGRGIFIKKDLPAGQIIGDYLGKVVHPADESTIQDESNFYLMWYHDRASIFPDLKKPGIHLLNHSCIPNVWMYTYKGHTLFFTTRKIFNGEELLVNYLLSPLDKSCEPCQHLCHCGTILCTSTMHLTERKYEKWNAFQEREDNKTKRERIRYNTYLKPLDEYPKVIKDDPLYTLFGAESQEAFRLDDAKLPSIFELRKLLRETGRKLTFPRLNIRVLGIEDDIIYTKPLSGK